MLYGIKSRLLIENLTKKAANWTCWWATHGPISILGRILLKCLRRRPIFVRRLVEFSERTFLLTDAGDFVTASPFWENEGQKLHRGIFPALRARMLCNVLASPYSPCVVDGRNLLMSDSDYLNKDRIRVASGSLFYMYKNSAIMQDKFLTKNECITDMDAGVLMGVSGAFNWYHYMIQCLPKAYILKYLPPEHDMLPIIVPFECVTIPSFADALRSYVGDRTIVPVRNGCAVRAKNLIVIDDVWFEPFNMNFGIWPRVHDYSHHREFMLDYIRNLRANILGEDQNPSRKQHRIFIKRPVGRRDYNQMALMEIALKYGFEPVSMEGKSLAEQASIFRDAEMIVGASGAAWVGMIFRAVPAKALSWLVPEHAEFCSYSTLANMLGHEMRFIPALPIGRLNSTYDAYEEDYLVSELVFERAVCNMIGA